MHYIYIRYCGLGLETCAAHKESYFQGLSINFCASGFKTRVANSRIVDLALGGGRASPSRARPSWARPSRAGQPCGMAAGRPDGQAAGQPGSLAVQHNQ